MPRALTVFALVAVAIVCLPGLSDAGRVGPAPSISAAPAAEMTLNISVGWLNLSRACGSAAPGAIQVGLSAIPTGGVAPISYNWTLSTGGRGVGQTIVVDYVANLSARAEATDADGNTANASIGPLVPPAESIPACPAPGPIGPEILVVGLIVTAVVVVGILGAVYLRRRRKSPPAS